MIQIEDTIVSFDIFVKKFCCDLAQCRGICCVEGDSGAPLEEDEPVRIETNYENIRAYMKPEGIAAVKEQGFSCLVVLWILSCPLSFPIRGFHPLWLAFPKPFW